MRTSQKLSKIGRIETGDVQAIRPRDGRKGRGTQTNTVGRYERELRESFDDGWDTIEEEAPPLETRLNKELARSIVTFNQSPDISFDRSINPYRGCEHGCVYCFARPSHAYLGHSAGLDFESELYFKANAIDLLRKEMAAKSYTPRPLALGVNTDAYQPVERKLRLTRSLLEVLYEFRHPVSLLTKSKLITRDIDLLKPMAELGILRTAVSLTTLDPVLARRMEPRAATPKRRLEAIETLAEAGVPVMVMTAPIIPALNEPEIETLLKAAASAGATHASYVVLRLPHELKDLFHEWLALHYPDRSARIINALRSMRGGKDYDSDWRVRGRGEGELSRLIALRFAKACRRLGLNAHKRVDLRTDRFRKPPPDKRQMQLDL